MVEDGNPICWQTQMTRNLLGQLLRIIGLATGLDLTHKGEGGHRILVSVSLFRVLPFPALKSVMIPKHQEAATNVNKIKAIWKQDSHVPWKLVCDQLLPSITLLSTLFSSGVKLLTLPFEVVILLSMTGLRNLKAIINVSFTGIGEPRKKENRCECLFSHWLTFIGAGGGRREVRNGCMAFSDMISFKVGGTIKKFQASTEQQTKEGVII